MNMKELLTAHSFKAVSLKGLLFLFLPVLIGGTLASINFLLKTWNSNNFNPAYFGQINDELFFITLGLGILFSGLMYIVSLWRYCRSLAEKKTKNKKLATTLGSFILAVLVTLFVLVPIAFFVMLFIFSFVVAVGSNTLG